MIRLHALTLSALLAVPFAFAQAPAPAPSPDNPSTPPRAPRAPRPDARPDVIKMDRNIVIERGHDSSGLGILPPGAWWKNTDTIAKLSLSTDQQKKMDDIFRQNRLLLIDVKASLEKEQINLEPILNAAPFDSSKALAEISRIADLRADLEKANARMLLGLRGVLTADQWNKLQADPHNRHGMPSEFMLKVPNGSFYGPSSQFQFDDLDSLKFQMNGLQDSLKALESSSFEPLTIQIPHIVIPTDGK